MGRSCSEWLATTQNATAHIQQIVLGSLRRVWVNCNALTQEREDETA
jgi:hypothetical protein